MLNAFDDITEKTCIKSYGSPSQVRLPVRPHIHLSFCHQFLVYEIKLTILFIFFLNFAGDCCVIRTNAIENWITIGNQGKKGPMKIVRIFFLTQEMYNFQPVLVRLCLNDFYLTRSNIIESRKAREKGT